ncbi:hypothetical protein HY638_01890 [Candidatus Woesearchaeota archaeon]|nr:hypothetical protein [Candidatus Woesearchaeota archaeon]
MADQVSIYVPSSSANVGLGYDIWCLGLEQPQLIVDYTKKASPGIEVKVESPFEPPNGRVLGHAGVVALEKFLKEHKINDGAYLFYEDDGYPVGGLGRSGAEAVGAIMAAAVAYGIKLSRNDIIAASARGEPGEHKDNVAASTNGRFNIIVSSTPYTRKPSVDFYDVPDDLGLVIGFSSHKKTGGTEEGRAALSKPVDVGDYVPQTGNISAATAALVTGNTKRFLELVWGDRFHQPRRSAVRFYGNFDDNEFTTLQRDIFEKLGVAWNVSGAGPNMQALYSKADYPDGLLTTEISRVLASWFAERGIEMNLKEMNIAKEGAYDCAKRIYDY